MPVRHRSSPLRQFAVLACLSTAVVACEPQQGPGDPATAADCQRVHERLIAIQLGVAEQDHAEPSPDLVAHAALLREVPDSAFLDACRSERDQAYVRCVLAATSMADYASCDQRDESASPLPPEEALR